jgi:hypothetical protein
MESECGTVPFEEGSKALLLFVETHFARSPHSCWLQRCYRGLFEWWAAFFLPIRLEKGSEPNEDKVVLSVLY